MKYLTGAIIVALVSLFLFPAQVFAKVMVQEKGIIAIPSTDVVNDDLFIGAESIDLAGTVTGSVFAGAAMGDFKGTIMGDLVLGIGNANISGIIYGDLYIGGGDIALTNARVDGNVIVGAGNLMIDSTSNIGGSLIAGAGNVKNSAPVGRSAMIGGGSIYIDNTVGKEARLGGGNIELGPRAAILGDLTYALGEDGSSLKQANTASVTGQVIRYVPPMQSSQNINKVRQDFDRFSAMAGRTWLVISFLGSLLIGFILLKVFPKNTHGLVVSLSEAPLSSLGIGFLIVIAAVPVLLMLVLTVIGIPLAGLLFLTFCLELHLAKLASAYALGRFVETQFKWGKMGVYGVFSIGLAIFYLVRAVPGLGAITSILFTWVGLGGIWLYTRSNLKNL